MYSCTLTSIINGTPEGFLLAPFVNTFYFSRRELITKSYVQVNMYTTAKMECSFEMGN